MSAALKLRRRSHQVIRTVAVGASLVACGSHAATSATPKVCTEIGAEPGVGVQAESYFAAVPRAQSIQICLASECGLAERSGIAFVRINSIKQGDRTSLTVRTRDANGQVLVSSIVTSVAKKVQPNGEGCEPVVGQVSLVIGANGKAHAA